MLIDSDAPTLENGAATLSVRDGRTYLSGTFTDGGSLASVTVYPQVMRTYKRATAIPPTASTAWIITTPSMPS